MGRGVQHRRVREAKAGQSGEFLGGGYNAHSVAVHLDAATYLADESAIAQDLPPYTWYKEFVERGAAEHGLPEDYVVAANTHDKINSRPRSSTRAGRAHKAPQLSLVLSQGSLGAGYGQFFERQKFDGLHSERPTTGSQGCNFDDSLIYAFH